ncbi:hypothetical protein [Sorangium sp. So ce145]|uniref:hypothetical protein n=1 Tax=Sorangium sp. So ce145 TaxID=3133285 RepID=UPI003F63BBD7
MSDVTETEHYDTTVDAPATGGARTAASVRVGVTNLANRTKWTLARIADIIGAFKKVASVDDAVNNVTVTAHGWSADQPVRFTVVGGSLPGGLSAGAVVYVRNPLTNTFEVSATAGGAAIDITSVGSGTIYVWPVVDAAAALFSPASGILPAGSLRAQISHLRDNFAKLTDPNTWTAAQTFQAAVSFLAAVTMTDLTLSGTSRLKLGSRAVNRRARASVVGASGFTADAGGFVTQSSTSDANVTWEIDVPHGSTLTGAYIMVQPNTHGSLPAVMPRLRVMRTSSNEITLQTVGSSAPDASGSTGAYNVAHPITVSGLSEVVDRSQYNYFVKLEGEASTNSMTGLQAGAPKWTATMTELPDA